MKEKIYRLHKDDFKELIESRIACIASNMITVDGRKVRYMYREAPDKEFDSGWRFFSGKETQEYADCPENFAFYALNTIANYDASIIPYLACPIGVAFEKAEGSDVFTLIEAEEKDD